MGLVCDSKALYGSRKEASRAASRLKNKLYERHGVEQPIRAYHCNVHHGWHIGHKPGWREETGHLRQQTSVGLVKVAL